LHLEATYLAWIDASGIDDPYQRMLDAGVALSPGAQFDTTETFESDEDDFMVSAGKHRDMIGDGPEDLDHGTFEDDDSDMVLVSPEYDEYDDEDDTLEFNVDNKRFDDEDIDQDEVEGLFDDLRESLDMFKRFTKYN
jgi:hypothetical protein